MSEACWRVVQVGDRVTAGDIYAIVPENTLMTHKVMVPPGARGNITWIADKGQYDIAEDVIEIEFGGQKKACSPLRPHDVPRLLTSAFVAAYVPPQGITSS